MQLVKRGLMKSRKITVDRARVLAAIRKNYDRHKQEYAEAAEGYYIEVGSRIARLKAEFASAIDTLEQRTAALLAARAPRKADAQTPVESVALQFTGHLNLRVPVSYAEAYETVIKMLEFEVGTTVELDTAEFEAYVMDKWDWADEFKVTSAFYAASKTK
jgi:hypothetical protein